MEKKLLLFILLISVTVFGQQKKFVLDWQSTKTLAGDTYTLETPYFNEEFYSFDFNDGLQFVSQWDISSPVNEGSVSISQINYSIISVSDLKDLPIKSIPNKLIYSLKNTTARGKQSAMLKLSPIINDNGVFKKVTQFQVNYSSGISSRGATANKLAEKKVITNSVLEQGDWFRFYIDTTGVFKLSKTFLRRLGVDVNNIDPRTIRLFGNGGRMIPFSNSIDYPFDVQENAIKFEGESDGVFNDSDYILFYGEGPKQFNGESNTNINCYTDKTY